jgi:hypothetical protein
LRRARESGKLRAVTPRPFTPYRYQILRDDAEGPRERVGALLRRLAAIRWLEPHPHPLGAGTARVAAAASSLASGLQIDPAPPVQLQPGPFDAERCAEALALDSLGPWIAARLDALAAAFAGLGRGDDHPAFARRHTALFLRPRALALPLARMEARFAAAFGDAPPEDQEAPARRLLSRTLREIGLAIAAVEMEDPGPLPVLDALWILYEEGLHPLAASPSGILLFVPSAPARP